MAYARPLACAAAAVVHEPLPPMCVALPYCTCCNHLPAHPMPLTRSHVVLHSAPGERRLLYHRIRPVFVFDGTTPALKKQTVAARRRSVLQGPRKGPRRERSQGWVAQLASPDGWGFPACHPSPVRTLVAIMPSTLAFQLLMHVPQQCHAMPAGGASGRMCSCPRSPRSCSSTS